MIVVVAPEIAQSTERERCTMSDPILYALRTSHYTYNVEHDVAGAALVRSNVGSKFTPDRIEIRFRKWENESEWELDLVMLKGTTENGAYAVATFATHTLDRMPHWVRVHVARSNPS